LESKANVERNQEERGKSEGEEKDFDLVKTKPQFDGRKKMQPGGVGEPSIFGGTRKHTRIGETEKRAVRRIKVPPKNKGQQKGINYSGKGTFSGGFVLKWGAENGARKGEGAADSLGGVLKWIQRGRDLIHENKRNS